MHFGHTGEVNRVEPWPLEGRHDGLVVEVLLDRPNDTTYIWYVHKAYKYGQGKILAGRTDTVIYTV